MDSDSILLDSIYIFILYISWEGRYNCVWVKGGHQHFMLDGEQEPVTIFIYTYYALQTLQKSC